MAHKYSEELQQLSDFLQSGIDLAKEITAPEMASFKLRMTTALKKEQNFIHSLLGSARGVTETDTALLGPVTHIFGERIVIKQPDAVMKTDIAPGDHEKEKFKVEVKDLYENFATLPVEKLFNISTLPGGEIKIRAVAKMAGFEGFEDGEIDEEYINGVKAAVESKANEATELAKAAKVVEKAKDEKKK
jgi:hypothetical protein